MEIIFIWREKMESVIHKIRFLKNEMGPAEKRIAEYILSNSDEIIGASISDFAAKCGSGIATIVRFSRRLGLDGYQELKLRIAAEMNAMTSIMGEAKKTDRCFDIFKKQIADISATLMNTESVLDPDALDKAAQAVMTAERIVIFGLGNSAAIAQDAAHKFLRLGLAAHSCSDNHMQAIVASHLRRGSVAIGGSHSGSSKDIVDALRLCKIYGATTICVTNYGNSPIVEASDIALFTKSDETKSSILAMSSRIAQLAIFDSIYTYIVLNSDKAARQAIYNTEMALQNKKY